MTNEELKRLADEMSSLQGITWSNWNRVVDILTHLATVSDGEPADLAFIPRGGFTKYVSSEYADHWRNKAMQLAARVAELERRQTEWLCEQCKCVHPHGNKGILPKCPDCDSYMKPTSLIERELRQQLAEAQKDAARYRWLKRESEPVGNEPFIVRRYMSSVSRWTSNHADEAIDAAMDKS